MELSLEKLVFIRHYEEEKVRRRSNPENEALKLLNETAFPDPRDRSEGTRTILFQKRQVY